jgi:Leucine-rich repeat (LRR) protein
MLITTIELEGSGLTAIPKDAFGNNITAKNIHLNNDQISSIEESSVFKSLPNLIQLSLDYNKMKNINGLEFILQPMAANMILKFFSTIINWMKRVSRTLNHSLM